MNKDEIRCKLSNLEKYKKCRADVKSEEPEFYRFFFTRLNDDVWKFEKCWINNVLMGEGVVTTDKIKEILLRKSNEVLNVTFAKLKR